MASPLEPSKDYEIFDEELEFRIREISELINANVPAGTGVITLLLKQAGENKVSSFFMSNLPRAEMLRLMRAYLDSEEAKGETGDSN